PRRAALKLFDLGHAVLHARDGAVDGVTPAGVFRQKDWHARTSGDGRAGDPRRGPIDRSVDGLSVDCAYRRDAPLSRPAALWLDLLSALPATLARAGRRGFA